MVAVGTLITERPYRDQPEREVSFPALRGVSLTVAVPVPPAPACPFTGQLAFKGKVCFALGR